jgi:hypothetical protein
MSKTKLKVVANSTTKPRLKRWKSDAEKHHLPIATVRGETHAPPLPKQGHEELERLIGKR